MIEQEQAALETETQDLGIAKPAVPDVNWARTQPMFIQPTKQRLDRKHQLVSIQNTSDVTVTARGKPMPQMHIVIDRFNQGHEVEPGQTRHNIDMLVDDIEYFIRERSPNRLNHLGQRKPVHPIKIIGFDPDQVIRDPEPVAESISQDQPIKRRSSRDS